MPEPGDMINLGFLSESEQELIMEVLRRDEELRLAEEQRVRKLKTELLDVKRRGAKRGSGKYSPHSCGRCQEPLSRLSLSPSQCNMCNHNVCRKCRTLLPEGHWLCSVCAKEQDLKKLTGDWFYDQRVNRFSAMPGHDLVRVSLKKRPQPKKRETTGEVLLRSTEANLDPPVPVARARQKNQTAKSESQSDIQVKENSGSLASRESFESKTTRSDTESADNSSLTSSKTGTESSRVTPEAPRRTPRSSPAGSSASCSTLPVGAAFPAAHSTDTDATAVKPANQSPDLDVERIFKKSIKRDPRPVESLSTMDLRDAPDGPKASMGSRSRSVPGLDIQEDGEEEEEEEDIDSLVSFHKRTMASSSSSLCSSRSGLGSIMSIYSEAGDYDSVDVSGDIFFSMTYDEKTQSLQVFIKECHGLACGDTSRQLSNPYVKCYLLPDKSRQSKKKTSVKKNTVNPVYNETLKYPISRSMLYTRSLLISVWHYGRLSRNAFLGEVEIPLDCRDLDDPQMERMALMPKPSFAVPATAFSQYKGELVISLKYIPPKKATAEKGKGNKAEEGGELHVLIKEARNLMAMKSGGMSDSFVKGYLYPTKAKTTKRKTPVVKKNLNPHYDHTFVYKELSVEQLQDMCLELTVWDKENMASNEFLGGVRLSSGKGMVKIGKEEVEKDSVGEEVSLWQKMMQYPDSWAEGTVPLRSTMEKQQAK